MKLILDRRIGLPLAIHTALFILVVSGLIPRSIVSFWSLALLVWAAIVPAEISVPFFAAAIPLFIAIPITPTFDNLTMSRPLGIVIFLRWFLSSYGTSELLAHARSRMSRLKTLPRRWPVASALCVLFFAAVLSLTQAPDVGVGIRRIIFIMNALLVPVTLYFVLKRSPATGTNVVAGIAYSAIVITVAAFIQLASTYLIDIYQFMRLWGEGIQLRQFGTLWSEIAIRLGNTWFAYYGPQLSLRVFSLFPDSHSFPIYLIFAIAALMAYGARTLIGRAGEHATYGTLMRTRANLGIVWVPLALLAVILSGTRGIWAAAAGLPLVAVVIWKMLSGSRERRPLWLWLSSFILVVALLFAVAYPIFVSPQFLLSKGNLDLFRDRIRSIIDFGETSNAQRLMIWSATVHSITQHPLLGVGVGNFPVVLNQQIFLARAGSTAHNIYLHVAAETGLIALAAWLWLWVCGYRYALDRFRSEDEPFWQGFFGWLLLALPWVAAYLLTDAALFDERALLLFGILFALVAPQPDEHHA